MTDASKKNATKNATDHEEERGERRRSRRRLRRGLWFAVVLVALVIVIPLGFWARYRVTHVVSQNALVKGAIANVGAQLDGVVTEVAVDVGDRVVQGQVILRFEDRHLRARVQQEQANTEKAFRELGVERLAIEHERSRLASAVVEAAARLASAGAQVEAAESRAQDARRLHQRRVAMVDEGVIGIAEVIEAEGALRTADALVSAAKAEREAARASHHSAQVESEGLVVREARLELLESQHASARAQLMVVEAQLESAVIRAPDDGWVVRRIVEPGVSLVVGQAAMSLWVGDDVWVEAWVDEDALAKVAVGSEARVTLKPYPDREFAGVVTSLGVSTDFELPESEVPQPRTARMRATPLVCVRIELVNPEADLLPGLSAVVGIRKEMGLRSLLAGPDRPASPAGVTP